jgi:exopolyphosphatase / guanosine-5'-triphosphate,3'-diphosphate pyrophosphatase
LGEGLGVSGTLGEAAIARTLDALRICSNKLKWHGVSQQRLIATEACRSASNGQQFIEKVKNEIGLELEIIDRETEARLAVLGAEQLIAESADSAVVFDIGGGSTEVMWVEREEQGFSVKAWISLDAGVVSLSERVGGGKHVTPEAFEMMRAKVRELLAPFVSNVERLNGNDTVPSHLLGTSGTVTTIAGVHLGLRNYDRSRVDGAWLSDNDVLTVTNRLLAMTYEQRVQHGCVGRERADLVLAGCAILEEIRRAFPAPRIRVADRGLREGILTELFHSSTAPAVT